jgi:hypothetical protein
VKVDEIVEKSDEKKGEFDDIVRNGKKIVEKKDVKEKVNVRDKIKNLEGKWKDMNYILEDKKKLRKERDDKLGEYEKLSEKVIEWIKKMEKRVLRIENVDVEIEKIKRKKEKMKNMLKE